jgi:hypothetical protein
LSQIVVWYKKDDVTKKNLLSHVTSCLEIVTKKTSLFVIQILDRKHALLKKQASFRFLQQEDSVSFSLSFLRMVENGGTGASSTVKSLLEKLYEAGVGKETWEV